MKQDVLLSVFKESHKGNFCRKRSTKLKLINSKISKYIYNEPHVIVSSIYCLIVKQTKMLTAKIYSSYI